MALPEMNPMASKLLGGPDFKKCLREQLLEAAGRTDDPAYRQRLLEVANGERPLRTLMNDPGFQAQHGLGERQIDEDLAAARRESGPMEGTPDEIRARLTAELERLGAHIPSLEEMKSIFSEVQALQAKSDAIVAAERLTGWGGTEERLEQEGEDDHENG